MLVATCALTDAAFGRFPHLPLIWSPAGVDLLILCGVLRDLIADRRVHKVYLYALPAFISYPDYCRAIVHPSGILVAGDSSSLRSLIAN